MQEIVDQLAGSDRGAEIARTLLLPYLNHAASDVRERLRDC